MLTQINGGHSNQTTVYMTNDPLMRTYSFVNIHRANVFKIFNTCECSHCCLASNVLSDWCVTFFSQSHFAVLHLHMAHVAVILKSFVKWALRKILLLRCFLLSYLRRLNGVSVIFHFSIDFVSGVSPIKRKQRSWDNCWHSKSIDVDYTGYVIVLENVDKCLSLALLMSLLKI